MPHSGSSDAARPETLAELGRRDGFDVVVVPPFTLDGRAVRSSDIRTAIAAGDLATASELLGREITVTGNGAVRRWRHALDFEMPMALPPAGTYLASTNGRDVELEVGEDGTARFEPAVDGPDGDLRVAVRLRSGAEDADARQGSKPNISRGNARHGWRREIGRLVANHQPGRSWPRIGPGRRPLCL